MISLKALRAAKPLPPQTLRAGACDHPTLGSSPGKETKNRGVATAAAFRVMVDD